MNSRRFQQVGDLLGRSCNARAIYGDSVAVHRFIYNSQMAAMCSQSLLTGGQLPTVNAYPKP